MWSVRNLIIKSVKNNWNEIHQASWWLNDRHLQFRSPFTKCVSAIRRTKKIETEGDVSVVVCFRCWVVSGVRWSGMQTTYVDRPKPTRVARQNDTWRYTLFFYWCNYFITHLLKPSHSRSSWFIVICFWCSRNTALRVELIQSFFRHLLIDSDLRMGSETNRAEIAKGNKSYHKRENKTTTLY